MSYDATSIVGNQSSSNFGTPTVALPPRQVQVGVKAAFWAQSGYLRQPRGTRLGRTLKG